MRKLYVRIIYSLSFIILGKMLYSINFLSSEITILFSLFFPNFLSFFRYLLHAFNYFLGTVCISNCEVFLSVVVWDAYSSDPLALFAATLGCLVLKNYQEHK